MLLAMPVIPFRLLLVAGWLLPREGGMEDWLLDLVEDPKEMTSYEGFLERALRLTMTSSLSLDRTVTENLLEAFNWR